MLDQFSGLINHQAISIEPSSGTSIQTVDGVTVAPQLLVVDLRMIVRSQEDSLVTVNNSRTTTFQKKENNGVLLALLSVMWLPFSPTISMER